MSEAVSFIHDLGFPVAALVALAIVLYKIGTICGTLLIDSWKAKDTRLSELEKRVETINNGQRESLETRLDQSSEAIEKMSGCIDRLGQGFAEFAKTRKCLHDSDAVRLTQDIEEEMTPDPEDLARIKRRAERKAKSEGQAER